MDDLVAHGAPKKKEVLQLLCTYPLFATSCALGSQMLYLMEICRIAKEHLMGLGCDLWDISLESNNLTRLPFLSIHSKDLTREIKRICTTISLVKDRFPEGETKKQLERFQEVPIFNETQKIAEESLTLTKELVLYVVGHQEESIESALDAVCSASLCSFFAKKALGILIRQRTMVTHNALFAWQAARILEIYKDVRMPPPATPFEERSIEHVGKSSYEALLRRPDKPETIDSAIRSFLMKRFGCTRERVEEYVSERFRSIFPEFDISSKVRYAFLKSIVHKPLTDTSTRKEGE